MPTAQEFKSMTPEQQRADRDRRRQAGKVKAATSRVGTDSAKATDALVLNPEKFSKSGAAQLRGEAATRSTHPSLRSSESKTRGQDVYNQQFKKTYGTSEKQAMIGNVVNQASQLSDYRPPSGEGVTPLDKANYEASYAKQVAQQAQQETAKVQKTVGARQETIGEDLGSMFQRQQAKKLQEREQVNPEYTALSEQEKIMNRFDMVDGQLVERSAPRIPEKISGDTGRSPMVDKMSTTQKQAVASAQREVLDNDRERLIGKDKPLSAGARLYKEQQQRVENSQQEFDQYNAQTKNIKSDVADLANTLGVTRDQELRMNADGTIDIINKETQEIIDPVAEAEKKYQEQTDRELKNAKEANQAKEDRIKSSHSDANGNLTQQGRRILARSNDKYQESIDVYEENRTEALEKLIISEKKRARAIETRIEAQPGSKELSVEDQIKRQEQMSIMSMINDKIDESRDNFGNPTMGFATAKRMVDAQLASIGGKDKVADYDAFKAQFQTGGRSLNEALDVAYAQTGNIQTARDFASAIGVPSASLKEQMRGFYEDRGFNPDEMDLLGTETDKQMAFLTGNNDDMEAISFIASQPAARGQMLMQTAKEQGTYAGNPTMEKWLDTQLSGGAPDFTFEQQIAIPALGKMMYGTRISDAETERVANIMASPEAAGLSRFELAGRMLGFDVKENKELGSALMDTIISVAPEEGMAGFDIMGLSKLLNSGKTDAAIRKVENFANKSARDNEGGEFVSEAKMQSTIRKYDNVETVLSELGQDLDVGVVKGTLAQWFGRAKSSDQKKIGAVLATSVAQMRNDLLGSAVTPAEEAFLEDALPKLTDTPQQIVDKLSTLKFNSLTELNSQRDVYGLPELTEEAILDKSQKKALYEKMFAPEADLTKDVVGGFEGFRTEAYEDIGGVPTIGYGFTKIDGEPVEMGDSISQEQADQIFNEQLKDYKTWGNNINVELKPAQQAALTSFEYNLGSGVWNDWSGQLILQKINEGNLSEAGEIMKKYNKFKSQETGQLTESKSLAARRETESNLLQDAG